MTVDLSDLRGSWESAEVKKGGGGAGKFESTIVEASVKQNEKGRYLEWAFTKPGLDFPLRKFIPLRADTLGLVKKELETLGLTFPADITDLQATLDEAVGLKVEVNATPNKAGRKNAKGYVILNYYFNKSLGRDRLMTEAAELFAVEDADDLLG